MTKLDPFSIRTYLDPDFRHRIRWVVWDPVAGIIRSKQNYPTEMEALLWAEDYIERRQIGLAKRMTTKTPKRPRDLNQWAKRMVDIVTGEADDKAPTPEEQGKNPSAVERGKRGGEKGGKARAAALSPDELSRQARHAARKRWDK